MGVTHGKKVQFFFCFLYCSHIKIIQQKHSCGKNTFLACTVFEQITNEMRRYVFLFVLLQMIHTAITVQSFPHSAFVVQNFPFFAVVVLLLLSLHFPQTVRAGTKRRSLSNKRRVLPTLKSGPRRVFIPSCPINSSSHNTHCRRFSQTA